MLAFQSVEDIHQLPTIHPTYPKIRELVRLCIESIDDYDPDIHGKVYLIEPGDVSKPLPDICETWTLYDVQWEGVTLEDGCSRLSKLSVTSWPIADVRTGGLEPRVAAS